MRIQKTKIADKLVLLTFPDQHSITSSLVRFQAHYDSPEFRGKIFSLEEFKDWYVQNSEEGKRTGRFTFYSDWDGFNFPSHVLDPFKSRKFEPLTDKETEVLETLQSEKDPFYTIGIHLEKNLLSNPIDIYHEIAHGLFYIDEEYRKRVLQEIESENLERLKKELLSTAAYHESVLDDELHAYSLFYYEKSPSKHKINLKRKLEKIFQEHVKLNNVKIPEELK